MHKNKSQRGFTLVELLVVIGILAILGMVAITALSPAKILARARDGNRKTDLGGIKSAIELYYSQNRAYPADGTVINFGGTFQDTSVPPNVYLRNTPQDPKVSDTDSWTYCYGLSGGNYTLCANVEDSGSVNSVTPLCTPGGTTGVAGTYCLTNPF